MGGWVGGWSAPCPEQVISSSGQRAGGKGDQLAAIGAQEGVQRWAADAPDWCAPDRRHAKALLTASYCCCSLLPLTAAEHCCRSQPLALAVAHYAPRAADATARKSLVAAHTPAAPHHSAPPPCHSTLATVYSPLRTPRSAIPSPAYARTNHRRLLPSSLLRSDPPEATGVAPLSPPHSAVRGDALGASWPMPSLYLYSPPREATFGPGFT